MSLKQKLKLDHFGLSYEYPRLFVSLEFALGKVPLYPIWALIWFVYHVSCLFGELIPKFLYSTNMSPLWLAFLTNLSYLVLVLHVSLDFIIVAYVMCRKSLTLEKNVSPWYIKLSWVLQNVTTTSAILVSLVYWVMLAKSNHFIAINKHGFNAIYVLLMLVFTCKPVRIHHVYQPMIYAFIYILINLVSELTIGRNLYPFLNWREKTTKTALLNFAFVFVSVPITHLLIFGFYRLKLFMLEKFGVDCKSISEKENSNRQSIKKLAAEDCNRCHKDASVVNKHNESDPEKPHEHLELIVTNTTNNNSYNH